MADVIISPNMSLPVPTVSTAPGPGWASSVNSCLSVIDSHTHAVGSGVPVTPAGLNINVDLPFGSNNATALRSVRFTPQSTTLALATDIGCLYEVDADLYYNDANGNQVRITQSGSVTGSAGTITGLPSGTASASFSAGTFTFQSATLTPATMAVGPLIVGNSVASSNTITIAPNAAIASNYNFTLPAALPASLNYMTLDNLGNVSYNIAGNTGTGAVVLATSPSLTTPTVSSGALTVNSSGITFPSGTMTDYAEGTWVPTFANVANATGFTQIGLAYYQRIGNIIVGRFAVTVTFISTAFTATISLPIIPNNNFVTSVNNASCIGTGGIGNLMQVFQRSGTKLCQFSTVGSASSPLVFWGMFTYNIDN